MRLRPQSTAKPKSAAESEGRSDLAVATRPLANKSTKTRAFWLSWPPDARQPHDQATQQDSCGGVGVAESPGVAGEEDDCTRLSKIAGQCDKPRWMSANSVSTNPVKGLPVRKALIAIMARSSCEWRASK